MTKSIKHPQCFALGVVLSLGILQLWCLLSGVGFDLLWTQRVYLPERTLELLRDGTPAIQLLEYDEAAMYCWATYHTLDGKRFTGYRRMYEPFYLAAPFDHDAVFGAEPSGLMKWNSVMSIDSGRYGNRGHARYLLHNGRGRGYFVVYETETKRRVGYIGRDGFSRKIPPLEKQFHIDNWKMNHNNVFLCNDHGWPSRTFYDGGLPRANWTWGPYLIDDGELLWINDVRVMRLRKIATPFSATAGLMPVDRDGGKNVTAWPSGSGTYAPIVLLRYSDRVLALDCRGKLIQTYILPKELHDAELLWAQLEDGRAIVRKPERASVAELYWFDASGKMDRHESVDLPSPVTAKQRAVERRYERLLNLYTVVVTAPCGAVSGLVILDQWPGWAATVVCSLFWAFLCFRRQRKYGLRLTWLWITFVLLFGLPAYLGYLAQRRWPVRLSCPHCGQAVPRDRPQCFACGRDFPPPALKGIEVFA